MIWFCYFCKKTVFLFWTWPMGHGDPIFVQVGSKNCNFWGFQQFFFRTTGFQLKLLILIESPNSFQSGCGASAKFGPKQAQCCEKSEEMGIIISFFHILHGEYLLKLKVVVLQTPEWKFKQECQHPCADFVGKFSAGFHSAGCHAGDF